MKDFIKSSLLDDYRDRD